MTVQTKEPTKFQQTQHKSLAPTTTALLPLIRCNRTVHPNGIELHSTTMNLNSHNILPMNIASIILKYDKDTL